MPVKTFRPLTPSTRYITIASYDEITKTKPEKSLVEIRKKTGGRNHYGRATGRGPGRGRQPKKHTFRFCWEATGERSTGFGNLEMTLAAELPWLVPHTKELPRIIYA